MIKNGKMKKIKYSVVEKKLIRNVFISVLIQVCIIVMFFMAFNTSHPIDITDTKQAEITVDDIHYRVTQARYSKTYWLIISENSTEYIFSSLKPSAEYSVNELYKSISVGDRLSLRYYETFNILGKINLVVEARTETETYRTLEEYNNAKQGVDIFVIILFFVIEVIFCAIAVLFFAFSKNTRKSICRKIKKVKKK